MEKIKENIRKFITFYHEFRIPDNPFFLENDNEAKYVFLSSPSRMGNHALMSMLDGHPQIPKIPGEDSFLTWSFIKANYDLSGLVEYLRTIDNIEKLASGTSLKRKWLEHRKFFDENVYPDIYNGIQYNYNNNSDSLHRVPEQDSFVDFQGITLDINYDEYHKILSDNGNKIREAQEFSEIFDVYLTAYRSLLNSGTENFQVDYIYACSGLRIQSLWALKKNKNAKLIVSLRRFESYAISMIKSFYKTSEIREEYLKEAWEQWFHKVVDYLYLKINYPNQVLLIDFDDIINESIFVAKNICTFLDVDFHSTMLKATVNGMNVKGNSSKSRESKESGIFYKSESKELDLKYVPEDYFAIWEIFNYLKYDGKLE